MDEGHFSRQLARARGRYRARMQALTAALEKALGPGQVRFHGRHTGLHFLLQLTEGPEEQEMVERAAAEGVRLAGLSEYYLARPELCPPRTVVVGYGARADEDVEAAAAALRAAGQG